MVQQKKDNKKQGKAEDFGITELDADEFCEQEAEKFMAEFIDERFYTPKMSAVSNDWHDELVISAENLTDYDAVKA